ncbi:hypothetical protein J6590_090122 [Homalodisca vitripennis]
MQVQALVMDVDGGLGECGEERKLRGDVRCVYTNRMYLRIQPLIHAGDISTNIGQDAAV